MQAFRATLSLEMKVKTRHDFNSICAKKEIPQKNFLLILK
jgi:hypothetical protein